MIETIIISIIILAFSFILLSITIIIKKRGKFPNTHVSGSKAMRKRGIHCVQAQDSEARKKNPIAVKEKV